MLDSEQTKMLKKIEKTRKQAARMIEVRRQNEERAKRLEEHKERQEQAITAKQLRILQDRKQRKLLNQLVSQGNLERLKSSGQQTYLERHMFTQLKHQIRDEAVKDNQQQARRVRLGEQQQLTQQEEQRARMLSKFKQDYHGRVNAHHGDLAQKNGRVKELEVVEMRMIDNLKNTQQKEHDAYRQLQDAIKESTDSHHKRLGQKR